MYWNYFFVFLVVITFLVKSNSSRSSPTYSDITIVNQLQSAVNDLNSSIMIVAENQRQQSLMLQVICFDYFFLLFTATI